MLDRLPAVTWGSNPVMPTPRPTVLTVGEVRLAKLELLAGGPRIVFGSVGYVHQQPHFLAQAVQNVPDEQVVGFIRNIHEHLGVLRKHTK